MASAGSRFNPAVAGRDVEGGGLDSRPLCPKSPPVSKPAKAAAEPNFEDALTRLEGIVEAMETEELALETLLGRYEEGLKLARLCHEKLAAAETRLKQLEEDAGGALVVKPVEEE